MSKLRTLIMESSVVNSSHVLQVKHINIATHLPEETEMKSSSGMEESLTCAEFGKHLHGVVKSLLAEQIEGIEVLYVVYLLLLITV